MGTNLLTVRTFGVEGVNISVDPLKMKDTEATQLQNAEVTPDGSGSGGLGALKQRGGLAALNGSAMSGSVLGIQGWPLKTTVTRTLYASLQTMDNDSTAGATWRTSSDGTSWSDSSTPSQAVIETKYGDENDAFDARRMVSYRTYIIYPGNGYTQDTDDPIVDMFDGTASVTITDVRPGPSSNGSPPFVITDMLTYNGIIYIAMHEPGGTAPDNAGRVLSLNIDTGELKQVATGFAATATVPQIAGGAPSCLAFYQGQLFVGLNHESTTDGIGKIVRCFPGVDTTWTSDVATLSGSVSSLAVFKGRLYAGTQSSVSSAAKIYERSATAGTYTARHTGTGAAQNAFCGSLHYHSGTDSIYAVEYDEGGDSDATIVHIKVSTDGTTWTTSRDVDANDITGDSSVATNKPGQMVSFNNGSTNDLYVVFRATSASAADGFIMRLSAGSWSKVDTDNFGGHISVLTQRSA